MKASNPHLPELVSYTSDSLATSLIMNAMASETPSHEQNSSMASNDHEDEVGKRVIMLSPEEDGRKSCRAKPKQHPSCVEGEFFMWMQREGFTSESSMGETLVIVGML